jgi:serine/threonine protein kinase
MEREKWQQIKEIFDAVLRQKADERQSFLDEVCHDDPEIRSEVESLLASFEDSFLESPAVEEFADTIVSNDKKLQGGHRLRHYEIIRPIGAGGMGEVYLAQDTRLHRRVAIKVLPAELSGDVQANQRFLREARAAATLDHPNICAIFEIAESNNGVFIVMQYIDGETLSQKMAAQGLMRGEAVEFAIQIADALDEAHHHGIVHRDVKPSNIIINKKGIAKVLDFGLAKFVQSENGDEFSKLLSTSGVVMGTVPFMSPEQVRGTKLDSRTDIFSLGVLLFEMLSGHQPFARQSTAETISAILNDEAPLSRISPEFRPIVQRSLEKDVRDRYQTASEMLAELKRVRDEFVLASQDTELLFNIGPLTNSTRMIANTSSAEYIVNTIKDNKLIAAAALLAMLMTATSLGYFAYRSSLRPTNGSNLISRKLTQLTFGSGLQGEPTWSPDGRFVAYSSDAGGNLDIWVQQVSGGNPVQITRSPAADWQPDWSPDGNSLVFRSERDGGGLFVVPALGGNERRISPFGFQPQWSADAAWVLFYNSNMQNVTAPPKIYVVDAKGGSPREILADVTGEFPGRLRVAWHPDGLRISLWGYHRQFGLSFWTVALEGGDPVRSEFSVQVAQQVKDAAVDLFEFRWAKDAKTLYFEGISKGVRNLWKVETDPSSLNWISGLERLTTGAGLDKDITLSPDGTKLAFSTRSERTMLSAIPFNALTAKVSGTGQSITPPGINALGHDVTRDGKKLAYILQRAEKREIWERSLAGGGEKLLFTADDFVATAPRWSLDGSRLAFARNNVPSPDRSQQYTFNFEHSIELLNADGTGEQSLTSANSLQGWAWDWTSDGKYVLASSARQMPNWGLYLFPVAAAPTAEDQARLIASQPEYDAFNGRFSPDERWVAFIAIKKTNVADGGIYVVPADGGEWVRITDSRYYADKPRWSLDGKTLYFLSNRSGFFNVWGVRLEANPLKPSGEAFQVTDFSSPSYTIPSNMTEIELALTADRLVVPIVEVSGNIWILDNVNQ